jgi:hypothetical protein
MNLLLLTVTILASLTGCSRAEAQNPSRPWGPSEKGWATIDGESVPDTVFRKSHGAFCSELLLISDPEFFEKWDQPSHVFDFHSVDRVERGNSFVAIVAFANPSLDPDGNPILTLDMRIIKPDGALKGGIQGERAWEGPSFPDDLRDRLELTTKYLRYRVEDDDALGLYRVEATLTDTLSNTSLSMTRTITVTPRTTE